MKHLFMRLQPICIVAGTLLISTALAHAQEAAPVNEPPASVRGEAAQAQYAPQYRPAREQRPLYLPYRPGPIPEGYFVESRTRKGLLIPGSIMFGVAYGLTTLATLGGNNDELLVPVLGPFVALSNNNCSEDDAFCDDEGADNALLLSGMTQAAGAIMMIVGIAAKSRRFVRGDLYDGGFSIAPLQYDRSSAGLSLSGRF